MCRVGCCGVVCCVVVVVVVSCKLLMRVLAYCLCSVLSLYRAMVSVETLGRTIVMNMYAIRAWLEG